MTKPTKPKKQSTKQRPAEKAYRLEVYELCRADVYVRAPSMAEAIAKWDRGECIHGDAGEYLERADQYGLSWEEAPDEVDQPVLDDLIETADWGIRGLRAIEEIDPSEVPDG